MKRTSSSSSPGRLPTRDQWERQWQEHWSRIGQPGYELPVGGRGGDEREYRLGSTLPKMGDVIEF